VTELSDALGNHMALSDELSMLLMNELTKCKNELNEMKSDWNTMSQIVDIFKDTVASITNDPIIQGSSLVAGSGAWNYCRIIIETPEAYSLSNAKNQFPFPLTV
jgi:hypothetical protein